MGKVENAPTKKMTAKLSAPEKKAKLLAPKIKRLVREGLNREQISVELKMSQQTLSKYAQIEGIHIPRRNRMGDFVSQESLSAIIKMRQEGKTLEEIGKKLNCSRERIRQILARNAPDVAIGSRISTMSKCVVCGDLFPASARTTTCSQSCKEESKRKNKWNRDGMEVLMALRDSGHTWSEISQYMNPGGSEGSFRVDAERRAQYLMTSIERSKYFPGRCTSSTNSACSHSERTKAKNSNTHRQAGLLGRVLTWMGFKNNTTAI